jgi:phosphoribosylglycinamide formyltransferase-1
MRLSTLPATTAPVTTGAMPRCYANVQPSVTFAPMPMRVAVCISGGGSNLGALLEAFPASNEAGVDIALVLSDRPGAGGLARARQKSVATEVLSDPADSADWLSRLDQHRIDLVVLAGFLKQVPGPVVTAFRDRIINIHPALLPAFGGKGMYGMRVHAAVIASGARESGCTVHVVNEEYDRGPILAQARVPVLPDDTPESLAARVLAAEHRLLPAVVRETARRGRPVPLHAVD